MNSFTFHDGKTSYILIISHSTSWYQSLFINLIMRYYSSYDPSSLSTQNQVNPRRAAHKCIQCACKRYGTHAQVLSQAPVHGHSKLTWIRSEKEGKQNAKNVKRKVWNKVVINSPTTAPSWVHNSLKQWVLLTSNTHFPSIPKTEKT